MTPDAPGHHEGIVLRRDTAGERHLRLTLLDPAHGLLTVLHKPASKSGSATVTPDLFDACEVFLDTPKGATTSRFLKEYRLVRRHSGIGRDYARLTLACRLANLLARNPHPPESFSSLHTLAVGAFDAFDTKPRPDAAYFKTLWCVARDEGWPVKEDFAARLRPGERELAALLLKTALGALTDEIAPAALVEGLSRDLELWLAREVAYLV